MNTADRLEKTAAESVVPPYVVSAIPALPTNPNPAVPLVPMTPISTPQPATVPVTVSNNPIPAQYPVAAAQPASVPYQQTVPVTPPGYSQQNVSIPQNYAPNYGQAAVPPAYSVPGNSGVVPSPYPSQPYVGQNQNVAPAPYGYDQPVPSPYQNNGTWVQQVPVQQIPPPPIPMQGAMPMSQPMPMPGIAPSLPQQSYYPQSYPPPALMPIPYQQGNIPTPYRRLY
jgi:hypothetical protein